MMRMEYENTKIQRKKKLFVLFHFFFYALIFMVDFFPYKFLFYLDYIGNWFCRQTDEWRILTESRLIFRGRKTFLVEWTLLWREGRNSGDSLWTGIIYGILWQNKLRRRSYIMWICDWNNLVWSLLGLSWNKFQKNLWKLLTN